MPAAAPAALVRRRARGRPHPAAGRRPRARAPGRRRARIAGAALLGLLTLGALALAYQLARKPSEVLGLIAGPAPRTPGETWARYGAGFRAHATALVRPALLAALAQAESQGDPLARTPWRWRWTWNPLALYAPASSAVGLYQLTDAAYEEARQLCVHGGRVVRAGPWHDPRSCWFNALYTRVVPGHAIEMTAARLDDLVTRTLRPDGVRRVPRPERERLIAVLHLCGPSRGAAFARRGFRILRGERCGTHDLARYVAHVERLALTFARLDAR